MSERTARIALGVAVAVIVPAWVARGWWREHRRSSALLSYRNALVAAEIGRVDALRRRSPPRTLTDLTAIVGRVPSMCDDKNEPGPLDDPRADPCPRGAACHEAFFRADWEVRRRIEPPDTRVWFDPKVDADSAPGKLRVHVSGCEPGDIVLAIEELEPAPFLLHSW